MRKTLSAQDLKNLAAKLTDNCVSLQTTHRFAPRQLVRWKQGLKNKTLPEYNEPAIVLDVLSEPVFDDEQNAGSPYFHEPLNLVLAVIDDEDDLLVFHYDGRRFEPFPEIK